MTPVVLQPASRVLLVLKPTRIHAAFERALAGAPAGEADVHALSRPRQLLMWKSHTQWLRANPRPTEYMLRLAYEWIEPQSPASVDLLIDAGAAEAVPAPVRPWLRQIHAVVEQRLDRFDAALRARLQGASYDAVVMLYRDGSGLGWRPLERELARLRTPQIVVLNGRRRAFPFSPDRARALRVRRFMETSWIIELALVPAMIFTAAALSLYDAVVPRARRTVDGR